MTTTKLEGKLLVSLVLPAYNEVDCLEPAVEKTMGALNEFTDSYEIIIAEASGLRFMASITESSKKKV